MRTTISGILLLCVASVGVVRADQVAFVVTPTARQTDGKTVISFAVDRPTDVEVSIINSTVRLG